jgi:hypothetical protein
LCCGEGLARAVNIWGTILLFRTKHLLILFPLVYLFVKAGGTGHEVRGVWGLTISSVDYFAIQGKGNNTDTKGVIIKGTFLFVYEGFPLDA